MRPSTFAALVDGAIPILGGIWGTLAGYRFIGKQPGESPKHDDWHRRFGPMMRIVGPLLIVFGLFQMARGLAQ